MTPTQKKGAGAQYTEVTLQDMEKFLQRAFRALKPTKGAQRGEVTFDLFLDYPTSRIGIRVWTSIAQSSTSSAGVGDDAIRVQFYNYSLGRPMLTGKAPIVKRTQGWRDSLKDRIEDVIEMFDDREEYWVSRT